MHTSFHLPRARSLMGGLTLAAGVGLAVAPGALAQSNAPDHAHMPAHQHHGDPHHAKQHHHDPHRHDPRHHDPRHDDPHHGDPHHDPRHHHDGPGNADRTLGRYAQRNLAADTPGTAELTDPDLINGWGLSFGPASSGWVSDAGTNKTSLFRGGVDGGPIEQVPIKVSIPGQVPTGQVFNGGDEFVVRSGNASGAPRFLFATATGTISGWNANVPGPDSMDATPAVTVPGASFTGLAISGDDRLYAADFHNAKVDVWDGDFKPVDRPGAFQDAKMPAGFAPFGIEKVGDDIVVTYAKQDARAVLDVPGVGNGFVDVYSTSGHLLKRLAAHGPLNSPWGIAQAPKNFGPAGGALLIGNFGDGRIDAYSPKTGQLLGRLADANGHGLTIPGVWALKFGNGVIGSHDSLLFTAGPAMGTHGLFGELTAAKK